MNKSFDFLVAGGFARYRSIEKETRRPASPNGVLPPAGGCEVA
jgi:hypothetical protein